MSREIEKKWFFLAGKVLRNPQKRHRCPNNDNHFIDAVITISAVSGKIDIELICSQCNERRYVLMAMLDG